MVAFKIIMAILALVAMNFLAFQIDKNENISSYSALCIGGIAICGIILGLFLAFIFY